MNGAMGRASETSIVVSMGKMLIVTFSSSSAIRGRLPGQVAERFPAFDLEHLVRAELIRPRRTNPVKTQSRRTEPAPDSTFYVLTSRGAEAIGLAQHTLHSD